ncbi:protein disulfide-isomerase [Alcanivorax sp. S71-1-4]|uniref:DsbC family protein n=1 Tax=Alcanivorax sp. S71-1-4 TaxID=1177159 RepID=UPI001358FA84|nr:DsbC family protein [Alcanivorax sp. S71-1-4]KAF0806792.1 protein disulfide-isomerase [Alcanivorax sp. S71-1-4]
MSISKGILLTLLSLCALYSHADGTASNSQLIEKIENLYPNMSVTNIRSTPLGNILEVEINGSQIIYSSQNGDYIFTGQLVDISKGTSNNLTEQRQQEIRGALLSDMNARTFITFPSQGESIGEIFVFTDTSCAYCQNFHKQIEAINERGITVHYIAFPRSGLNTPAAQLMEQVWCSPDPRAALTEAKLNGRVSQNIIPCQAPVAEQFKAGLKMGVHGTPYILTESGENLGGYLSTEDLVSHFK